MRTSSTLITKLEPNEIFVFGSNLAGIHGAGAAKTALEKFGAVYGVPEGQQGQSYAIPTKDHNISTLPLSEIKTYVERFIARARRRTDFVYLVTEIGCGLAGYTPEQIAPLFKDVINIDTNIYLPRSFNQILWKIK